MLGKVLPERFSLKGSLVMLSNKCLDQILRVLMNPNNKKMLIQINLDNFLRISRRPILKLLRGLPGFLRNSIDSLTITVILFSGLLLLLFELNFRQVFFLLSNMNWLLLVICLYVLYLIFYQTFHYIEHNFHLNQY